MPCGRQHRSARVGLLSAVAVDADRIGDRAKRRAEKPRVKKAASRSSNSDGLEHTVSTTTVEIKEKMVRDVEVHANELQTGRHAGCSEGNAAEAAAAGATSRSADASQRRFLDACAHFLAIRFLVRRQQLGRIGIGRRRAVRIGEKTLQTNRTDRKTVGVQQIKRDETRNSSDADARSCCCLVRQAMQA
jgi:hypothetical protein